MISAGKPVKKEEEWRKTRKWKKRKILGKKDNQRVQCKGTRDLENMREDFGRRGTDEIDVTFVVVVKNT